MDAFVVNNIHDLKILPDSDKDCDFLQEGAVARASSFFFVFVHSVVDLPFLEGKFTSYLNFRFIFPLIFEAHLHFGQNTRSATVQRDLSERTISTVKSTPSERIIVRIHCDKTKIRNKRPETVRKRATCFSFSCTHR